ncbi:hypothetical protein LPTSP4_19940 [Leptospira ryugenii]|uniref:DUF4384 domain-containing protein n=1 Tax=Leptospira ryugenii TaxID=1917863 RepID=A0A2P2E0S5_9LEPT|nr:DUF4384 domain-containing protein [Leptospira ryugenii]GBF50469.1 hypothetical protein LPTSP4_19940 [Leptospira ryugenii]
MNSRLLILVAILTIGLFAEPKETKLPIYKYALLVSQGTTDALEISNHLRGQIIQSKRGDFIYVSDPMFSGDEKLNVNAIIEEKAEIKVAEKLILLKDQGSMTSIQLYDIESGNLEYKNSLPSSMHKTLFQDFYAHIDKKNIYLALSEKKSSPSAPIKITALKSKYVAGEPLRFELEVEEDHYVYVLLVPESKQEDPVLIFPNSTQTANFLKKGEKVTIPENLGSLRTAPPFGKDKIKAFASKEAWDEFQFKNKKGDSFFKLLPPALTSSKSIIVSEVTTQMLKDVEVAEWEITIAPN